MENDLDLDEDFEDDLKERGLCLREVRSQFRSCLASVRDCFNGWDESIFLEPELDVDSISLQFRLWNPSSSKVVFAKLLWGVDFVILSNLCSETMVFGDMESLLKGLLFSSLSFTLTDGSKSPSNSEVSLLNSPLTSRVNVSFVILLSSQVSFRESLLIPILSDFLLL